MKFAEQTPVSQISVKDLIVVDKPGHPLFDASVVEPLPKAMKDEIAEKGVQASILVTPADKEGKYYVVAGRTRTRIARELGIPSLDARVVEFDLDTDDGAAEAVRAMMIENNHRKNESQYVKAEKLRTYFNLRHKAIGAVSTEEGEDGEASTAPVKLDKESLEEAMQILGVTTKNGARDILLLWNACQYILQQGKKGKLPAAAAIEIIRKAPDDHEKQKKLAQKFLEKSGDKAPTQKEVIAGLYPIGQRAVKTKELKELFTCAYVASTQTVRIKQFAGFLAGALSAEEQLKFKSDNPWVEDFVASANVDDE